MSFGRLLAAGRSLIGLRNGESRYRENKQVRLPKFISPKNPFATAERNSELMATETPGPAVSAATVVAKLAKLEAKPAPVSVKRTNWLGGLRGRLNPFGTRGATTNSAKAGVNGASRQGELALDRVQVMRNDLSDAEGKVGQPQLKAVPGLPVMSMTMVKFEPVSAAWNRLAAKFIGTDQT